MIQDDGYRAVIRKAKVHLGAELPGADNQPGFPNFGHKVFVKPFGRHRFQSLSESGPPSFSGIGVEFAGAVAGFLLVGYWIDRHYDSSPWGVLIGAVLGLVGGMYNLIRESLAASRDAARNARESHGPHEADRS